jgi:hypothetical protein
MSMETNLKGRLRNTNLPKSHGLMPLFEGVVNAIHSIEEFGLSSEEGRILIEIVRQPQGQLNLQDDKKTPGREALENIMGFKITDNGIGFDDANLQSFQTLDSDHKADKGCRGVGRLLWLKAFKKVSVTSTYQDADLLKARFFSFDATKGVGPVTTNAAAEGAPRQTCVHLDGFVEMYRDAAFKTADTIASSMFEHCLWYFVRSGGAPTITIHDNGETINLDHIYDDHMHTSAESESFDIKGHGFDVTHVKLRTHSTQSHQIAYCAANRLVKEEGIAGKIPGLYGKIRDDEGEFVYVCYICSEFLDENVRSERTGFDIMEEQGDLLAGSELSLKDIRDSVIEKATTHLDGYLEENKQRGRERVEQFVAHNAPRYRPILSRIPEADLLVDPNMSDKQLDLMLHKHLFDIEAKLLTDGHDFMQPALADNIDAYKEKLAEYLKTAEDIKKSDLANYVSHRKVVLDLLAMAIERQPDGSYAREDLIHNLIMPMGTESGDLMPNSCNLWLIDERLAFHNYLASDKTLRAMPITGNDETKEPDICVLNVFDNPIMVSEDQQPPFASIEVIEIKRPLRNDAAQGEDKDPIEQSLGYLERIRNGQVSTAKGRPIHGAQDIPGYCYILCDLTSSMLKRCKIHNLTRTSDGLGYFGYNDNYKAYMEVISFDRLVHAAKQRNRAFFDQLGLPTN